MLANVRRIFHAADYANDNEPFDVISLAFSALNSEFLQWCKLAK